MVGLLYPAFVFEYVGILLGVGIYLQRRSARTRHILKPAENIPRTSISALQPNTTASITGTVEAAQGELLTAPFSKERCVAYHFAIVELSGRDQQASTLIERSERCDFFLRDETGVALVKIDSANVKLSKRS